MSAEKQMICSLNSMIERRKWISNKVGHVCNFIFTFKKLFKPMWTATMHLALLTTRGQCCYIPTQSFRFQCSLYPGGQVHS